MELEGFPEEVASALQNLTSINLARNCFTKIPPSVSHITTLQSLDMSYNRSLQLRDVDLATVAAMPALKSLAIPKGVAACNGFSMASVNILFALRARFPSLHLPGFVY